MKDMPKPINGSSITKGHYHCILVALKIWWFKNHFVESDWPGWENWSVRTLDWCGI